MNNTQQNLDEFEDIGSYKRAAIKAAKDFRYGKKVIEAIQHTDNVEEISDIMCKARHRHFK